jgi:hypothetical protein
MANGNYGLDTASDVMKQLVTISSAVIAGVLAVMLANKGNTIGHCWAVVATITGGLSILSCLLFLTDTAAKSLGSTSQPLRFQRVIFIFSWFAFYICILCAAVYVFRVLGVV